MLIELRAFKLLKAKIFKMQNTYHKFVNHRFLERKHEGLNHSNIILIKLIILGLKSFLLLLGFPVRHGHFSWVFGHQFLHRIPLIHIRELSSRFFKELIELLNHLIKEGNRLDGLIILLIEIVVDSLLIQKHKSSLIKVYNVLLPEVGFLSINTN